MDALREQAGAVVTKAVRTSLELFKIMVPITIAIKITIELGLLEPLGVLLAPLMKAVGLPGAMGVVWGAALVNFYAGVVALASLAPPAELSQAQGTVLTTMMLVAHSLPVELRIAQRAGSRIGVMTGLRVGSALLLGWMLSKAYAATGALSRPYELFWEPPNEELPWSLWALEELQKLLIIFLVILLLVALMEILKGIGAIDWLTRLLEPLLRSIGIGREAAPLAIVGMVVGLTYGGGLIIEESKSGRIGDRDVFFSLALMGLSHGLIEDSLLVMALGGHPSGILWARLIYSLLVITLLVRALRLVPERSFRRFLFRSGSEDRPEAGPG